MLNVRGNIAILSAVLAVRASLRKSRIGTVHLGSKGDGSVIVQQFVAGDVSAVVFSADPVTGDGDVVIVNSAWGFASSIVGGSVTPDRYVIRRNSFAVTEQLIADKRRMSLSAVRGVRARTVPLCLRTQPSLDTTNVRQLAPLALEIERAFGWPVDLECTRADGVWHVLQCRPIT
jgi:pyruvate,water dikinase